MRRRLFGPTMIMVGLILLLIAASMDSGKACAAPSHKAQPYGGCKEAWQSPHSRGADGCRAAGWTIWPNVVFTPRGRIVYCNRAWCR